MFTVFWHVPPVFDGRNVVMVQTANWKRAGNVIAIGREEPRSGAEADLRQIERACREIAFCELAEAMAQSRIAALRGAVAGGRAEIAAQPECEDLRLSVRTLECELASFEETLPIECAYRADQRDIALARLSAAQARLRAQAVSGDGVDMVRLQAALALSPRVVVHNSRQQAAARIAAQ
ncbi:hypothetical protein [Paenirhodobacter sp.]|uniref:hypothetical protein n=1 Tax=Paenirhodobacter sp. TaxID=1965326 RepID=UPI003B514C0D